MANAYEAQVMIAARDSLQEIVPGAGYATRPKVAMGVNVPTPLTNPMLLVSDASGSFSERIIHYPPMWQHAIRFSVRCLAHGSGDDGRVRELGNLVGDVRRRFRIDRTLGGLVERVDEIEPDDTDESLGGTVGENRLDFRALVTVAEED